MKQPLPVTHNSKHEGCPSSLARREGQLKGSDSPQGLCLATGWEEGLPGSPGATALVTYSFCP